ncbi:MAG: hypothetical protein ACPGVC_11525, partial [Salibacteraceae bacterium]
MRYLILFIFLLFELVLFGQNEPPKALIDQYSYLYGYIKKYDSIEISSSNLMQNDDDPNWLDKLHIDTIFYTGPLEVEIKKYGSSKVSRIIIKFPDNFTGSETLSYRLVDDGTPTLADTGLIKVTVRKKEYDVLDINNIAVTVHSDELFAGPNHDIPAFEAPKGSSTYSIFRADLWMGGKVGHRIFSNNRYWRKHQQPNMHTGNTGPVTIYTHNSVLENTKWDQVWKVNKQDINRHIQDWKNIGYIPPFSIRNWPAHGDTTVGEPFYVAPFIDQNDDGIYNPLDGDYPKIKGDQAIYFVYNDGSAIWSPNPMNSEVHVLVYAFTCKDSALQNTIFVDYRIINKSQNTYDSTYFGMWVDGDLGYSLDDRIQCDVDRGLYYQFNGDDFDDDNWGRKGYGNHPAAQGIMTLKGARQDIDGIDNQFGILENQTVNGNGFGDGIIDNEHWGMESFRYYWGDN